MAKSFDRLATRMTSTATRRRAAGRARQLLAELLLSEMRILAGRSQRELAEALGIKQPSLSKLENQSDMQISTLQRIVEALGGQVQVLALFPRGVIRVKQFDRSRKRKLGSTTRRSRSQAREVAVV